MNNDLARTVAHTNPELELVPGERLRFEQQRLKFEGANGHYMPLGSQNGILLALSFRDDNGQHTYGSAAMVGPGLAICAAHVIEEQGFYEKIQSDAATLVASAPLPDGGMHLWTVLRVALVPNTDLAVLSMALTSPYPTDRRFVSAAITTRMPALGDVLTVTGLSAGRGTEAISNNMHFEMIPGCMFGQVIDRYPDGRGRMMPGPCVAVECHARGGMSGGPVFDSRGYLVGIVSSSFEGMETTFVSHIWPALVLPQAACPVWPPVPYPLPAPGSLLHLGRKFGIDIERPDAFKLGTHDGEIVLRYVEWE